MLFSSDEETDHEQKIILTAVSDGSSSDEGTEPASRCECDNSGKPNLDSLNDEDTTILNSESTNLTKHDYDNADCTGNSDCGSGAEEDVNDDIVRNSHDCTKDDSSDDSMMDSYTSIKMMMRLFKLLQCIPGMQERTSTPTALQLQKDHFVRSVSMQLSDQ